MIANSLDMTSLGHSFLASNLCVPGGGGVGEGRGGGRWWREVVEGGGGGRGGGGTEGEGGGEGRRRREAEGEERELPKNKQKKCFSNFFSEKYTPPTAYHTQSKGMLTDSRATYYRLC